MQLLKLKHILLLALTFTGAPLVQAQSTSEEAQPELATAPPAQSPAAETSIPVRPALPDQAPLLRQPRFSLAMGSAFSRFGNAAYFQPTVVMPVTRRFQGFASVQFINTFGNNFNRFGSEAAFAPPRQNQLSYVAMAGGNYLVNDRLNLTGSVWKEFSPQGSLPGMPLNVFGNNGGSGMSMRANYKITENLSVSGGLRIGSQANYNRFNPGLYQYHDPFGF